MNIKIISVIVPCYNEEGNILDLHASISKTLEHTGKKYEIIFIDDGSTDKTLSILQEITKTDIYTTVIVLQRNYGQTAAMMAGFDHAKGEVIISLDGDGQNDPADIPKLLDKISEGYDVVSGWRKERKDNKLIRNFPSFIANWIISRISGVALKDYGCSLKAYNKQFIKGVRLYGEMHRFIPIYSFWQGAKIIEIEVAHRPRIHGKSNYGLNRIYKVILDILLIRFFDQYLTRPIHLFGGIGLVCTFLSFLSGLWALWLKFIDEISFISTPVPLLTVTLFLTALISFMLGIIAELITRTYYESQEKTTYIIRQKISNKEEP